MSLLSGLQPGLESALLSGLGASLHSSGAPCTPYPDRTISKSANTNFPITAADFATACGVPGMLPTNIFDCQETTDGEALVCALTGRILLPRKRFNEGITYGKATTGLEGGTRTAVSIDNAASTDGWVATDTNFMNPFHGSCAAFAVFKASDDLAAEAFLGYGRAVNGSEPAYDGGILTYFDTVGRIAAAYSDGTTAASTGLAVGDKCDGNWYMAGYMYDATNADCEIMHDTGLHVRSLSGLTFIDMQSYFTVGFNRFNSNDWDIAYLVCFDNATAAGRTAAEACTQAGISTFKAQAVT